MWTNVSELFVITGDGTPLKTIVDFAVVQEFGFASIEVEKMAKMPLTSDPRAVD